MSIEVINIECPHCGAAVDTSMKVCKYCDCPVIIRTFHSVASMPMPELNKYARSYQKELAENPDNTALNQSIAMCYLKLKQYRQAVHYFEEAMRDNFDDASNYFYAATSLLEGKKAFLQTRAVIEKIETYINDALSVEPLGIHYYYWAYIKYDFFERKGFRTSPNYKECLGMAGQLGVSDLDKQELFALLGVPKPEGKGF